jgi:hypothetical protein
VETSGHRRHRREERLGRGFLEFLKAGEQAAYACLSAFFCINQSRLLIQVLSPIVPAGRE